jgi:hypothetical protein
MSGYDPIGIRVQPALARIHREAKRGMAAPVPFATVCIGLNVPSDLHSRLLRHLVDLGYVTEISVGRVQLTEAGTSQVAPQRR